MKEFGQSLVERSNSMLKDNKEKIISAKKNKNIVLFKNFTNDIFSWNDFFNIFKNAEKNNKIRFVSFGTCTIDSSEQYTNLFNKLINHLSSIHTGQKISTLSIIHFITGNDNELVDQSGQKFKEYFLNINPNKMPETLPPKEAFSPTIHSDPVDGFFIQFQGSTLWKIYYDSKTEEHYLNSGDMIFIPKELKHSVESMCPRNAISVSFSD